ncbi:type II secretion system F family protein [Corynebacterium aquatimens]|uniref:Tight adherence protein B n=1 Tax=Corynebacterium aquatimens TaxID=1190508 RepID=A0A931DVZ4_9CORY|nr:type II secretion system F family protein [Corynebacterium aquatimens]MBG6122529.1 tight adherence protein B [Corynebacterium aquatimens]WJY64931.1 hypothetical protein CAQUA_00955 [Corynebacterium aquatimens]
MSVLPAVVLAAAITIAPPRAALRIAPPVPLHVPPALLPVAAVALTVAGMAAGRFTVVASACVAVLTVCWAVSASRDAANQRARRVALAGYLGHVVAALKAGSTLPYACERARDQLPDSAPRALAGELDRLVGHTRTGGDGASLLRESTLRELRDVGALWALSAKLGIPVADLLASARTRIDQQLRHADATNAALAGPKATAVVLSVLPLAGIMMGQAMGAAPVHLLFGGGLGGVLLLIGTCLVCAGFASSQHIIRRATR